MWFRVFAAILSVVFMTCCLIQLFHGVERHIYMDNMIAGLLWMIIYHVYKE